MNQSLASVVFSWWILLTASLCAAGQQQPSLIGDLNPGIQGSIHTELGWAFLDGKLYFAADDGTHGIEPYSYDGSVISLVADLNPGAASSNPSQFTATGNAVYFTADDGQIGVELWKYDGNNLSYMQDLHPGTGTEAGIAWLTAIGNEVFFSGTNGNSGLELWKSDGITSGLVADIIQGAGSSSPSFLTPGESGEFYFAATDMNSGTELFHYSNGSVSLVADVESGGSGSTPFNLVYTEGQLYFTAYQSNVGYELWVYDPVNQSHSLVQDICSGTCDGLIFFPTAFTQEGGLVFSGNDNSIGQELWWYDGSQMNSFDIYPGMFSSAPAEFHEMYGGMGVFFNADHPQYGRELFWLLNGNVTMIQDIQPGAGSSEPRHFWSAEGYDMFFAADDGINGEELWRFDGGPSASMVWDIHSGSQGSSPLVLGVVDSQLVFAASDAVHGQELWMLSLLPGVEDLPAEAVRVYPNPSSGQFNIQHPNVNEIAQIEVYDLGGKLVEVITSGFRGNLSIDLPEGMYTLVVRFNDGAIKSAKLSVLDR